MTLFNKRHGHLMSRCAKCDHDLYIRDNRKTREARAFCTNRKCLFSKKPHPTGSMPNKGKAK